MKSTKGKKPRARSRASSGAKRPADDCTIPPPIAAQDLPRLVLPRNDDEVQKIAEYVEWQAKGERVEHAEKVSTEHVMGRKHECWDVRTNKERYWVITEPTNLYWGPRIIALAGNLGIFGVNSTESKREQSRIIRG